MTSNTKAWIITGPTSGIGYRTALELAQHGTVVLVGRSPEKLDGVRNEIESTGGHAAIVVADLGDITSVRHAADEITALHLPIAGLLNNAGIFPSRPGKSAQGWDIAFATNHLGPFALTEALIPTLPEGAHVVFIVSAVEDPDRTIAVQAGFRGSRYISAEASAAGEWLTPGGSKIPGMDAYATSKQGPLATTLAFAREYPRLRFSAIEPGVNPGSNLGRDMNVVLRGLSKAIAPVLQLMPHYTTPKKAAKVIVRILTSETTQTGTYFDEDGNPMRGSAQVRDPEFQDRVVAETRALLSHSPRKQLRTLDRPAYRYRRRANRTHQDWSMPRRGRPVSPKSRCGWHWLASVASAMLVSHGTGRAAHLVGHADRRRRGSGR